jgi:CRISPR-associated protein Cas1
MSSYVLHVLTPQVRLSKYRGFLRCMQNAAPLHQIPLEDIKCVVLAARAVSLSSEVIAALMEHKVGIIHCDSRFVPCGVTMPMVQTINPLVLEEQVRNKPLKKRLWEKILRQKITNQATVLQLIGANDENVLREANAKMLNESAAARLYFSEYFKILGSPGLTRRSDDGHKINIMLNYGYAILQGLVHRSLVAYGISPLHGLHHVNRYQAHAMVYDIMEPWRPIIDLMVWNYLQKSSTKDFADFKKYIAYSQYGWQTLRFTISNKSVKMINAIDIHSTALSDCFKCQKTKNLWVPKVEYSHLQGLTKWDGAL